MERFLPVDAPDLKRRGWGELDIVLVTGDAYVDHPSYGTSLIARVLTDAGFKVGIIAQPDWQRDDDFKKLGRPRLFFGITAGNLDSMVANYTANKKIRSEDEYSPSGKAGLRPDRAVIIYTNRIKALFHGVPVVLGGIEASLRRLGHYDYWSDTVRRSILLDSKADILVYGMGERQTVEIARRLDAGVLPGSLDGIPGTVVARSGLPDALKDRVEIPSFEDIARDKKKFNKAFRIAYAENDPFRGRAIVQHHAARFVIQFPPAAPLTTPEMDAVYGLKFARSWHPSYDDSGGVPGFETVRFSVISHRGCAGACNFCSFYMHQGRIVQSRSAESILKEIGELSRDSRFTGTITDIGGPTANLYMAKCRMWETKGACRDRSCLLPGKCDNLKLGYDAALDIWDKALKIPGVRHVFVGSGVRYDLLAGKDSDRYLERLSARHVSGLLKVAPEHCEDAVLELMNKAPFEAYKNFRRRFEAVNSKLGKRQFLVNYIISGHPGSTLESSLGLSLELMKMNIRPEQIQDYIPLPMTASGCMYYTGMNPFTDKEVYVARSGRERKLQRSLIQYWQPGNRRYVIEALRRLKRMDLAKTFLRGASRAAKKSEREGWE